MTNNNKNLEQAINNVMAALSQYRGTLAEHNQLQKDLGLMMEFINKGLESSQPKASDVKKEDTLGT